MKLSLYLRNFLVEKLGIDVTFRSSTARIGHMSSLEIQELHADCI